MKTLILTTSLLFAFGGAYAGPFYLDVGTNYDGLTAPDGDKECDTCTSMKNEFTFAYESITTIQDDDASGTISAGDDLSTDGGLAVGDFSNNQINGFLPNEGFGSNSNNGYGGGNWALSFSVEDLQGQITGVTGGGIPLFSYGPGTIEMFLTFDGSTFINFMDVAVAGGGATGVSTILTGSADFSDVDGTYGNLFHSGEYECDGSTGFYDIWSNCGEGAGEALEIAFFSSFDTNIFVSDFEYDEDTGLFSVASNHEGSAAFSIPEPSILALLGSGLLFLGLFGFRRRG